MTSGSSPSSLKSGMSAFRAQSSRSSTSSLSTDRWRGVRARGALRGQEFTGSPPAPRPRAPPLGPRVAAQHSQLIAKPVAQGEEMADVLRGVALLVGRERPARPVAALHVLRELHADLAFEERLQAELGPPAEARRDVRVEDAGEGESEIALEERDVVLGGVEDLFDGRVGQHRGERREIAERQRIDQPYESPRVGEK